MAKGGARTGAGRKSGRDEIKSRNLCLAAIEKKYGSLEKGVIALLESKEPTLMKFVYEHALGKPVEKVDLGDIPVSTVIKFMIPKNGRELAEEAIKATNGNGNGHHN